MKGGPSCFVGGRRAEAAFGRDARRPRVRPPSFLGDLGQRPRPGSGGGGTEVSEAAHVLLALILTMVLVCQARALASVLHSRRLLAKQRKPRVTELVWVAIPVAVVLVLAARSWLIALDLGLPAMASVAPAEVSAQPSPRPVLHR